VDLRQFIGVLRTRWRFWVVVLLAGCALTVGAVASMAPVYGSTTKLFIATSAGGQAEYQASFIVSQRVASYADLAVDPALLQRVIAAEDLDVAVEELADRVDSQVVESTQTIEIMTRADSPQAARAIARELADQVVDLVERLERPQDDDQAPAIAARVATDASLSDVPVAPNVPLLLAAGFVLSLLLAISGALLRHALDRSVKARADLEHSADVAVLASLPNEPKLAKEAGPLAGDAALAEAFRVLWTNLQFANVGGQVRTLLVTSALPHEGKTLAAVNLARTAAQMGRSVLLIDADMRNPNVANRLGVENAVGVLTVLLGRADLESATQDAGGGVYVLATGPKPPNPAELLATDAMRDLLTTARETFDLVIVDAPPMLPVADASLIAAHVDGVLLLARYGKTAREHVRLAAERLDAIGARLLGGVINRSPRRGGEPYGYGYGYGYGAVASLEDLAVEEEPGRARRVRARS
jgi:capsular exopolysaccharide synthesis family protein